MPTRTELHCLLVTCRLNAPHTEPTQFSDVGGPYEPVGRISKHYYGLLHEIEKKRSVKLLQKQSTCLETHYSLIPRKSHHPAVGYIRFTHIYTLVELIKFMVTKVCRTST